MLTFDEKLAKWQRKQQEPYKVPKSKNASVSYAIGAWGTGKRLPKGEFEEKVLPMLKKVNKLYGKTAQLVYGDRKPQLTPQQWRERQATIEQAMRRIGK